MTGEMNGSVQPLPAPEPHAETGDEVIRRERDRKAAAEQRHHDNMKLIASGGVAETPPAPQPSPFAQAVIAQVTEIGNMLIAKNKAYGNSALDPVRVFSKAGADEQIRVRIDDKISRLMRGQAAGDDVVLDLIGYLILLRISQAGARPAA